MSRTYRFTKSKNLYKVINNVYYNDPFYTMNRIYSLVDFPKLMEKHLSKAKKEIPLLFSDKKPLMIYKGPSWFHRMSSQKPHRIKSKNELNKFKKTFNFNMLNDNYDYTEDYHEVIIENKPKREYWF